MEDTLRNQIEELRWKEEELKKERWDLEALLRKKKKEGYQKLKQFLYENKGQQFTLNEIRESAEIDEEVSNYMLAGFLCQPDYNRVYKGDSNRIIAGGFYDGKKYLGDIKRVEVPLYEKTFKKKNKSGRIVGIVVPHQSYYYFEEK
jgi:hypothetical protein